MAYILSLEIGGADLRTLVANMTEPARLLSEARPPIDPGRGTHYVVRETDAERAKELSGEFYPDSGVAEATECVTPSSGQSDRDEQLARICELSHRLGYNDSKAKMLIGQSVGNLAELERKLLSELDEQADNIRGPKGDDSGPVKQLREEEALKAPTVVADSPQPSRQADSQIAHGFLF